MTTATKQAVLRLFFLSMVSLFAELLVIRWLSADIRAFSIFKTFPLVSCYVGLGLGLASKQKEYSHWFMPSVLCIAVVMKVAEYFSFGSLFFPSFISYNWQAELSYSDFVMYVLTFLVLLPLVLVGPLLMSLAIGSEMAEEFNKLRPLSAYSVNLLGALTGSVLFASLSFAGLPPWLLLTISSAAMLVVAEGSKATKWQGTLLLAAAVAIAFSPARTAEGAEVFWSPYQRLDLTSREINLDDTGAHVIKAYALAANHLPYQEALSLTPQQCEQWGVSGGLMSCQSRWMLPYQLRNPGNVLVVASGLGSDVSQALWYGAESVDAVDIDPVIIKLGKQLNPLSPYADPRVRVICDDARHYFGSCKKKYDLIVFSHLDSHTVVGVGSSVRLDNYVYTIESVRQSLSLLRPNGIMVVSFWTTMDWLKHRLYGTITAAAGYRPVVLSTHVQEHSGSFPNTAFILGKPVRDATFKIPDRVAKSFDRLALPQGQERILTDDWPFLYLGNRGLDPVYVLVLIEIIAIASFCSRSILVSCASPIHWQLFFMGAAFMLLELEFISRLALLFGSTWITTSVVINGVLLLILFANLLVSRLGRLLSGKLQLLYALLFVSLMASYCLPLHTILHDWQFNQAITYGAICAVTFLPVFAAAIIFSVSFARVSDSSRALSFNILGAVIGALLEYLTIYIGINALLFVVAGLYALSLPFALRGQKAAPS